MNTEKWLEENTESLKGKTVAISGATGGIGNELCRYFAALGADIIMLDRNTERSLSFAEVIKGEFPNTLTEHIRLDLEDVENVRCVTEELIKRAPDYLILNAGAYHIPIKECALGYNNVFQINYISPYYMAKMLLPTVKSRGGRIIAVGSIANDYSKADIEDIDFSTRKKSSLIYGNAKRHIMYSLSALDDESIAIAHPGITFTNITAHYPKLIFAIIKHPMKIIFMKPKKACLSVLSAIFEKNESGVWFGPCLFNIWGAPCKKALKKISEEELKIIESTAEAVFKGMSG